MLAGPFHWRLLARAGLGMAALLGLAPGSMAESATGTNSASARVTLRVVIPPVFRVLQVRHVPGAVEYRIWTNMQVAHFNGRIHRFEQVGENVLLIPAGSQGLSVVPSI